MVVLDGITRQFDEPFFSGVASAVSQSAVLKYDVVINGHGYMLDLVNQQAKPYGFSSIPMLRAMFLQDRGTVPIGEHSLNPDDYWRRSVDDWSAGSGQKYLDHPDSINNQYRLSKGIDPWTQGQITLLPDTTLKTSSANTNLDLAVAGGDLYVLDGTALKFTTSLSGTPSYTTVTGTTLSGAIGITTDGYTVWVADANDIYYTTRGAATRALYLASPQAGATIIKTTKGRLFTAVGNTIYTFSGAAGAAVATPYFVHPNSDWTWTAIEGGFDAIYFAGYSGTKSMIYAATIKTDGTALDIPIAVASLPTGEIVRSMKAYFSVLIVGLDTGWRAAVVGGQSGQLTLGALVPLSSPPKCFEAQDRFLWFGYTNYDGVSTGLGRIDLSVFNNDIPAYASDLMATGQGTVTSVATFQSLRVFTVAGLGLYAESTDKVASGTINSGWLHYALADIKIALRLDVQNRAGAGSYTASIAKDDDTPVQVGNTIFTNQVAGSNTTIGVPQIQGRAHEVIYLLTRSSSDHTLAPVLDRSTLLVEPAPERRTIWTVPLMIHSQTMDHQRTNERYTPILEIQRFYNLVQSRSVVPYQTAEISWNVIVDDFEWVPYNQIQSGSAVTWDGTLVVMLKVVG